jgi:phospholipase/carboxylesterase
MSDRHSAEGLSGLDHIAALVTATLQALHALGFVSRHLDPERLGEVVASIGTPDEALRVAAQPPAAMADELASTLRQLDLAAQATLTAYDMLRDAAGRNDLRATYQATRREALALESLFLLVPYIPAISDFFLEAGARADQGLRARLAVEPRPQDTGLMHAANSRDERGGFSLLVPETYTPDVPHPLVVALHGGSGHGRMFVWNWVREARARGLIIACPTSTGGTWALGGPDQDTPRLAAMVGFVRERWNIDTGRMLLTGMSDGGSFSLLTGLQAESPFTHLAPVAAGFHPLMAQMGDADRVDGLPIYIVHGARDWMFPVELAHQSQAALSALGARVTYREVEDLAHVYPRDENAALADWLMATPAG